MRMIVALIAVSLIWPGAVKAQSGRAFVTIALPHDISVEIPKNWVVLSNNQRVTVDASVQSSLDLSRVSSAPSELPFAANLYDERGKTIALVNIRYYTGLDITQTDVRSATIADVQELDAALNQGIRRGMEGSGMTMSSWTGTAQREINDVATFISEYHRHSIVPQGDFRVRLVRVLAGERTFTLTVSYWEPQAQLLEPIANRIIGSLQMARVASESRSPMAVTSESPSPMALVFGDRWPLVLMLSALLTWGIGLAPPLALRFGILRRPIGKGPAFAIVGVLWILNVILFTALGSQSRSHGALALVAFASYAILRNGSKRVTPITTQNTSS